jgi:hypothetical protein
MCKTDQMKHLLTAIACFFALSMSAQTWNPDADFDNVIGVNDLMELLSVFGTEWTAEYPQDPAYELAAYYEGEIKFVDCISACASNNARILSAFEYGVFQEFIEPETGLSWDPSIATICSFCSGNCGGWAEYGVFLRMNQSNNGYGSMYMSGSFNSNSSGNVTDWTSLNFVPSTTLPKDGHCVCAGLIPAVE